VAHSWAELDRPSVTTPTLEAVSFVEAAHQGSPSQTTLASSGQMESHADLEPTILHSSDLTWDSCFVTMSHSTSPGPMQDGLLQGSPATDDY
jgi:hypothetical protein